MSKRDDIDALIGGLQHLQKEVKVEEVLEQALSEPQPTEDRLRQIEQALETFQSLGLLGGDDVRDLHLLLTLGRTYERLSHLEKAFETYEKALVLANRHEDTSSRAELLGRMGRVLTRWQRWDDALSCLDQSQEAYEALGDELGLAQTIVRRGTVFIEKGEYEQAQSVYEAAREVGDRIGDTKTIAQVTNNLAILATIRGDFEEAVSQYEACIPLYEQIEDQRGLAGAYQNLGMAHTDHQDWTQAMDAFERGFEVAQANSHLDLMANIHLSMAEVMLEMGNSMMVPHCCARALDIYRKTGDHLGEADAYRLLGRTFGLRKDWATAAELFGDSLRLGEEHGNPLGVAETYRDLGRMKVSQGRMLEARTALGTALSGFEKLGARGDVRVVETLLEKLEG